VALRAEHVPERDGAGAPFRHGQAALFKGGGQLAFDMAALADAGEIALHIGQEHGHAHVAERFGQFLQRDGFARAGGAGDQAVAVGHAGQQKTRFAAVPGKQDGIGHEKGSFRGGERGKKAREKWAKRRISADFHGFF